MPRKQRNKSSNGNSNGASQPSATKKSCSDNIDGAFPHHLLRNYHGLDNDDALETLVPNAVFVARHALSSKECQDWINFAEGEGNNKSKWDTVSHPATKWIAHRECGRIQKDDWDMSHRLYQRIEDVVRKVSPQLDIFDKASLLSNGAKFNAIDKSNSVPKYQPVSCNPNLRLYKYTKGQWFGRHVDGSNKIDFPCNKNSNGGNNPPFSSQDVKDAQTEITVLFYLSSCRGGATRFHLPHSSGKRKKGGSSGGVAFTPEEGAVLLHVHGDHCLEHEAEPVFEGVKYGK
ncbi:hypothetical protein ACHAXR_009436 [Thalassiosira sp. AJA248-18]